MSSSAKHSAMDLMFLKEASRAPVHSSQMAWLTRRRGDTSTACLRTVPARPILVESSRGAGAQQPDGLVDTAQGRHIDGLPADGSGTTDPSGVLARPGVDDGANQHLKRVVSGGEVDDLEAVLDDPHGHELL